MKNFYWIILLCFVVHFADAQNSVKGNREVYFGNKAYEKGDWKTAMSEYQKGLNLNPKNDAARINLALAQSKLLEAEKATQNFDEVINNDKNNTALNAILNYDKGVTAAKAKKYPEAIDAFKNSLRTNPDNQQARENLQKAINELKQQQQNKQQQNQRG
jgi:tetratricopeptide (TPR) repeat protein